MFAENVMNVTMLAMAVAPATEPVESRKTCMKGNPVGVFSAFSTSFTLNRVTSKTTNPKAPFMNTLIMMERGATRAAF